MSSLPDDGALEAYLMRFADKLRREADDIDARARRSLIEKGRRFPLTASEVRGIPCAGEMCWDGSDEPIVVPALTHAVVIPDPELRDEPPGRPI